MDNKKLKVKDLVSIGVFGVIYFAFMFGVGMMGLIPILFLIYPTVFNAVNHTIERNLRYML
ncbi:major facilitator superfamily permease [Streptococcus pneumoniae]|nr:major facilitator superfamily permease [Streptococcus pneumoniae]